MSVFKQLPVDIPDDKGIHIKSVAAKRRSMRTNT